MITGQAERDKAMDDLLQALEYLYGFVIGALRHGDIDEAREKLLKVMSSQTIQCAYFIRDHVEVKNFCENLIY